MSSQTVCKQVQQRVSRWLDGRLDADTAAIVDQHLDSCSACRSEFAAMRELSRQVAAQGPDDLPDGFAARVREAAVASEQSAPRTWQVWMLQNPIALRLAAAAFVIIGLVWAYDLGRAHGRTTGSRAVQTTSPVAHDSPAHMRAARSLASDLGVIDRIPEKMRRPMLRAQIDHFELDRWANVVRREVKSSEPVRGLANLVAGLSAVLDDEARFGAALTRLRADALQPSLWGTGGVEAFVAIDIPEVRNWRDRRDRSVHTAAKHMSPGERSGLDRLLQFKEHLACGNPWPFITLGQDELDLPNELRPSVEVMIASSLGAAGLDEMAGQWMQQLQQGSPDVFELLSATIFDGRDPMRAAIKIGSTDLEERLQSLFDKTNGSGDIVIKESSENGGYSFQVFIRTEAGGK